MKFHRIALRDYRGIRACVIEPRESGVTIIEGDNEVGKSSIAEALWLIFEQNDDSSSQLVRNLRPADRDTATEIEVEVSTGPYRFTYSKRFHRAPRTELVVTRPRREVLAGREAHNRARQILEETMDTALWKALRSQQGDPESLDPLAAGQHRSLLGALDLAAGALMGGEREQTVFAAAQQEYERYFTASGREKSAGEGSSAPKLRAAETEALAEVERISSRMRLLEERTARAAELASLIYEADEQSRIAVADRDELEGKHAARRAAVVQIETATSALRTLEETVRRLAADRDARARFVASLAPRAAALEAEIANLETLRPNAATAAEELSSCAERARSAESAANAAATALRRVEELIQLSGRQLQADQMAERLGRLEQLQPAMNELRAWLEACRVDQQVVGQLEEAERRISELEFQREAEGASVEVNATEGAAITVNGHETVLAPGQTVRGKVVGERVILLPGGITITIRAGSHARELETKIAAARKALAGRLASIGVESVVDARLLNDQRIANTERQKGYAAQVRADLRDLGSADELRDKLQRERRAISSILANAGLQIAPTVDESKALREQAARADSEARAASMEVAALVSHAHDHLSKLQEGIRLSESRITAIREEMERAEFELASLRQGLSDEDLAASLADAELDLATARSEAELAAAAALSLPDVSGDLEVAEARLRRVADQAAALRLESASIEGVLEDAGAVGLHGQLVEAEQRLAHAANELAAFSRRASAARLLFESLRRRRDEARENYAGPLKARLEALGRRVYNESFGVELSDDLQVVRRSLDGISLDLAQVSVGGREQISVLTRLACAALVSADGGAPLVLDDILGWADPKRLQSLGPVLAAAAAGTQVLLFTCSPERFASVRPARVVTLPSGRTLERAEHDGEATPQPIPVVVRKTSSLPRPAPQASFDLFEVAAPRDRSN